MKEEIWKDIEGYKGLYQVSNFGRVKSLYREFWSGKGYHILNKYPEKIMKTWIDRGGYEYVVLCKDSIAKKIKVHRLVAQAFIPNPDNKSQVDHINTIRYDNHVENLRWATKSENELNPITRKRRSTSKMGNNNPRNKVMKKVAQIEALTGNVIKVWDSAIDAAKSIGVDHSNIYRAIYGQLNTCRGYKWKYKD